MKHTKTKKTEKIKIVIQEEFKWTNVGILEGGKADYIVAYITYVGVKYIITIAKRPREGEMEVIVRLFTIRKMILYH